MHKVPDRNVIYNGSLSTRTTHTEIQRNASGSESWVEVDNTRAGVVKTRTVTATPWEVVITHCFCCSCDDHNPDPYCRNHGFAGERPCEEHNMPGSVDENGTMPDSVQVVRRRQLADQDTVIGRRKKD